jgi:hypothetical protein
VGGSVTKKAILEIQNLFKSILPILASKVKILAKSRQHINLLQFWNYVKDLSEFFRAVLRSSLYY